MSDLKSQLAKLLEENGLNPDAQNLTIVEETGSADFDDIIDAEVVDDMTPTSEPEEEDYDSTDDYTDDIDGSDSIEEAPSDDRYDEEVIGETSEDGEPITQDFTMDDLEKVNEVQPPVSVNLLQTYGEFADKQAYSLTFHQHLDINAPNVDENSVPTNTTVGRVRYILRVQGSGENYNDAVVLPAIQEMYAHNGVGMVNLVGGTREYRVRCLHQSLNDSANYMRKSAQSALESLEGEVDRITQVAFEEIYRPNMILNSAIVTVTRPIVDEEDGESVETRAFLTMLSATHNSYTLRFQAELKNYNEGKKFKFHEDLETLYSAFEAVVQAASVGITLAHAHTMLGKTKWFNRYSITISNETCNHVVSASFRWTQVEKDIFLDL